MAETLDWDNLQCLYLLCLLRLEQSNPVVVPGMCQGQLRAKDEDTIRIRLDFIQFMVAHIVAVSFFTF